MARGVLGATEPTEDIAESDEPADEDTRFIPVKPVKNVSKKCELPALQWQMRFTLFFYLAASTATDANTQTH